jgi:uncharacterized protein (DUF305 family)
MNKGGHDKLVAALAAGGVACALAAVALTLSSPAQSQSTPTMGHAHTHVTPAAGAMPGAGNTATTADSTFYSEMADVDARMHASMAVMPTGNIDRDFARMMIPHHQGAIDMALVLLKYGHDERLKRLAQSIIVEQGQEIAYMHTLFDPLVAAAPTTRQAADQ